MSKTDCLTVFLPLPILADVNEKESGFHLEKSGFDVLSVCVLWKRMMLIRRKEQKKWMFRVNTYFRECHYHPDKWICYRLYEWNEMFHTCDHTNRKIKTRWIRKRAIATRAYSDIRIATEIYRLVSFYLGKPRFTTNFFLQKKILWRKRENKCAMWRLLNTPFAKHEHFIQFASLFTEEFRWN